MIRVENPKRFIFFIFSLLVIFAVSGILLFSNTKIEQSGEFVIEPGTAARAVWRNLSEQGFTGNTLTWHYFGWRKNAADSIQAGTYQLETGETVEETITRFITGDASTDELTITYPEGFTVSQMAARTAANNIGTEKEFLAAAEGLEGYLFPDTYKFLIDDTPQNVIKRMQANFNQKITDELKADIKNSGRTLEEVIIMASIVEREVITDDDMAKVAGVLWSRLDDGTGLGADATVRYALDKWDDPLTIADLDINSPYNTRKFRGLPPGPISNPGLRAIIATIRPEESDFYYYLSAHTGETIFSKTLAEHNQNKAKYLR